MFKDTASEADIERHVNEVAQQGAWIFVPISLKGLPMVVTRW